MDSAFVQSYQVIANREQLITELHSYSSPFQEEKVCVNSFLELLSHHRAFHRDHLPGHITASAWIVDEDKTHALLIHHAKLDKWLQPGGHADGDENVLQVATREVNEETGLTNLTQLTNGIFDIDIHPIPARKDFPAHMHYDIRFAFIASRKAELKINDESHDLKWINLEEVAAITKQNTSILRMIRKTLGGNQH